MGPALAIIGAVGAIASAGLAAKGLFSKNKSGLRDVNPSQFQREAPSITQAEAPSLTTDAESAERDSKSRMGSIGLTSTSPLGLTQSPNTSKSKLTGS